MTNHRLSLEPEIIPRRQESCPRMAERGVTTYWVITVKDPGDRETGVLRYERRFEFDDLEAAFHCTKGASEAGFEVSVARVLATRERSSSTMGG